VKKLLCETQKTEAFEKMPKNVSIRATCRYASGGLGKSETDLCLNGAGLAFQKHPKKILCETQLLDVNTSKKIPPSNPNHTQGSFLKEHLPILPSVTVSLQKEHLRFEGPLGELSIHLKQFDPLGSVFFKICLDSNESAYLDVNTSKQDGMEVEGIFPSNSNPGKMFLCETQNNPLPHTPYISLWILASRRRGGPKAKALLATLKSLLYQSQIGVSRGWLLSLECVGIGFRAQVNRETATHRVGSQKSRLCVSHTTPSFNTSKNSSQPVLQKQTALEKSPPNLELKVGQSHLIIFQLPPDVRVFLLKPTLFCLYGVDKQKVKQVGADIRAFRPPEPYKGKGIRYRYEVIPLKHGKKK
jgi:ribosomal protein L6P/L9E